MHTKLATLLQGITLIIGIAVLAFMLWEPHVEGRNANATWSEIYFQDPFLAYVYAGSTPFFLALYRFIHLLGHLKANGVLLPGTVGDLIRIRNCAIALAGFIALGMVFILLLGDSEDHPAGLMMGLALLVVASSGAALTHWSTRRCLVLLKTDN
jgi:hypothetical protein